MLTIATALPDTLWRFLPGEIATRRRKGEKVIVLVPEQYTLFTEQALLSEMQLPGFFDIDVLSLSRLRSRVFSRAGSPGRTVIDSSGRRMALSRALHLCRDELCYYRSAALSPGMVQKVDGEITRFKQCGITPDMLASQAESMEPGAAKDKLQDLACLYGFYEQMLEGRYMDSEDETRDMLLRLPESGLCQDTCVFVYGFDMLTEPLNRVLYTLSLYANDVILLCAVQNTPLFRPVKASIERLTELMRDAHIMLREIRLPETVPEGSAELGYLCRCLLQNAPGHWEKEPRDVVLHSVPNSYTEMHLIAAQMLQLNRQGTAFGDMVLVTGSNADTEMIRSVMDEYAVPVYIAAKLPAVYHGACGYLLNALRSLDSFAPEAVTGMITSGYSPLTDEEGFVIRNYMEAYGIRGKLFLHPFTRGKPEEAARAEEIRMKLIPPLVQLREAFGESDDIRHKLTAVYRFLVDSGVPDRLTDMEQSLQASFPEKAVQCAQVWPALMELLSQMDCLLTGLPCDAEEMADQLEAGLTVRELSALPPSAGCVVCGRFGNIPLNGKKAVFATGLCDSLLDPSQPGLLNDEECKSLQEAFHKHLSLSGPERDMMHLLDIYKTFSSPRDMLFLSYPLARQDGTALRPVSCLSELRRIFPCLRDRGGAALSSGALFPYAPVPVLYSMPARMRHQSDQAQKTEAAENEEKPPQSKASVSGGAWQQAWNWLCQSPVYAGHTKAIRGSLLPREAERLPEPLTRELFMGSAVSVSRLETFAQCPFKHFIQYGLNPVTEKPWDLERRDIGSFYHESMESFTRMLSSVEGWPRITKAQCDAVMDEAIRPVMDRLLSSTAMQDSKRLQYTGDKYKKAVKRIAWLFTRGARNSLFRPQSQEIAFGMADPGSLPALPLTLPDGTHVYLQGRIDRVDRYEGDEGVFFRVIDYKSSAKSLDPAKVFYGEQLQLLLYLAVCQQADPAAGPAGMYYFHMDDPLVEEPENLSQIEDILAEQLCLSGITLRDARIVRLMDNGEAPRTLPRLLRQDGDFIKSSPVATMEEMRALITLARDNAVQLAASVLSGDIRAEPLTKGSETPCTFCDYASICRRERNGPCRNVGSMSLEELLGKILTD